ncbi:MAG: PDDEXK nuclease domain-containing protein [Leptospirales bacterium]|nr:PDDEXK nuclease domain-containing protein [Leptospirales bacterium]
MMEIKESTSTSTFFDGVAQIIEKARAYVGRTADFTMCITYFEVGRMIVEEEQDGKVRAKYGRGLLKELSKFLGARVGKGFSETNLRNARKFYQTYASSIQQFVTAELESGSKKQIQQLMTAESEKSQLLYNLFNESQKTHPIADFFKVSWTHYVVLIRIKNEDERNFYELEVANNQWTVDDLKRQYNSSLYERLALSRDKAEVMRLAKEGQIVENPRDILKNPLVLEFLGMAEDSAYSETDLESAIISKLQKFLLELGKGFLFEARQKRFSFDEQSFFVDLIFYNRLLQCHVLVDLKTSELKHQDLGQMQMYVNYFDRYVKKDFEKPTVGILLCREKNDNIVELTLPTDSNIYASAYSLYLPDKDLLQRKLSEWVEEFEEAQSLLHGSTSE